MNKRIDRINTLFAAPTPAFSPADNPHPIMPRVSAGSVRSVKDTFTEIERENEYLRGQLQSAFAAIEINPQLVDPSPLSDRFCDDDDASFQLLKQSIEQRGQEIPVLVRPHPTIGGRYQSAYGHRRVRATRELGIPLKAFIKDLSDEGLIIAQGLENAAREDLSFIERSLFAMRIEDAGHDRSVIQNALSIDRTEASRLVAIARSIPQDIVHAIGKSSKIGRPRWQSLVELLKDPASMDRARAEIVTTRFADQQSDARFLAVLSAASHAPQTQLRNSRRRGEQILTAAGKRIGHAIHADHELKLTIDKTIPPSFATFLVEQLPTLFDAFSRTNAGPETTAA